MTQHSPSSHSKSNESRMLVPVTQQPYNAKHYINLGDKHYHTYLTRSVKRDLDSAIGHYRRALEVEPTSSVAYVKLASALWDKGEINLDNAMHYCQLALSHHANEPIAHLFLGYFLKKAGRLDEAMVQFRRAIQISPFKLPKARIVLGASLLSQASKVEQSSQLRRLDLVFQGLGQFILGLLLLPFDFETVGCLWRALINDIRIHCCLGFGRFFKSTGSHKLAGKLYELAAQWMPTEPIFLHLLGDYYFESAEYSAAIYFYNRSYELNPDDSILCKKLGQAYGVVKDHEQAVRCFEKALELEPDDFESLYFLSQVNIQEQSYMRALYYLKESARRQPSNPYVHSHMGYVMFKLEDVDGAIEAYRTAISYGHNASWTSTVAQTLGTIYFQIKKDTQAALDILTFARELSPSNVDCLIQLAEIYFEMGNFQAALNLYDTIQELEPNNPDCYNYVGYLLWQMDRNDEAIKAYKQALIIDCENAIAYNNLGVIYLDEQFQAKEASLMFAKALDCEPDYTLAAFNLARSQEMLGEITYAAKTYSKALELNTMNPELDDDEILERIDGLFKL